jgi:hypothetical protein
MATNPAASYGTDIACLFDADELFTSVTGIDAVYQDAFHRLTVDNLIGPDGDGWGFDVRNLLGIRSSRLAAFQPVIAEVLKRDPRIETAAVTITSTTTNGLTDVVVDVKCTTAQGPFEFTLSVASLTAAILENQNT